MSAIVKDYTGDDIVIPRQELETLGLKPGDRLVVRREISLERREWNPGEWERLKGVLDELHGSWTEEQVEEFYRNRNRKTGERAST